MRVGEYVDTPRFCKVEIAHIYEDERAAREDGYTEPTYYENPAYGVRGKSLDRYHMLFAAYKKP